MKTFDALSCVTFLVPRRPNFHVVGGEGVKHGNTYVSVMSLSQKDAVACRPKRATTAFVVTFLVDNVRQASPNLTSQFSILHLAYKNVNRSHIKRQLS